MAFRAPRYSLPAGLIALAGCYLLVTRCNVVSIFSEGAFDEQLFIDLGTALARGQWLGTYYKSTLVKGPGYPMFLALNHWSRLPVNVGQALVYLAAAGSAAFATLRIARSRALGVALFLSLLFLPAIYLTPNRIIRDHFYTSLTLVFFSSLLLLVFDQSKRIRLMSALLAGFSAAGLWITREEGVWIVPSVLFALAIALWSAGRGSRTRRASLFGLALACALLCTGLVGAINASVYGRFVISELKDRDFQSALAWLQRASFAHWRPYFGVPREARMELYRQSPAFASLKAFLDPPDQPSPWNVGCGLIANTCGDIVVGWFVWALRDGAESAGAYTSAGNAAAFYRRLAQDLQNACDTGELVCATWYPSFLPAMTLEQLAQLHRHFLSIMSYNFLIQPVPVRPANSAIDPARRDATLWLLNFPPIAEPWGLQTSRVCHRIASFQAAWMSAVERSQPIFSGLFVIGTIAFAAVMFMALRMGRFPPAALAGSILAVAILTRTALLALIDATSFPTTGYHYELPSVPLLLIFSFLSIYALLGLLRERRLALRGDAAAGPVPTSACSEPR